MGYETAHEEGLRRLNELFGGTDDSAPKRSYRRYILESQDGSFLFRFEHSPRVDRDEMTLMVDQIIDEEFDNNIVPRKLAYFFPTSRFEPWHKDPPRSARYTRRLGRLSVGVCAPE
jgi:hypothetical protein